MIHGSLLRCRHHGSQYNRNMVTTLSLTTLLCLDISHSGVREVLKFRPSYQRFVAPSRKRMRSVLSTVDHRLTVHFTSSAGDGLTSSAFTKLMKDCKLVRPPSHNTHIRTHAHTIMYTHTRARGPPTRTNPRFHCLTDLKSPRPSTKSRDPNQLAPTPARQEAHRHEPRPDLHALLAFSRVCV